jgi:hypothetical protein
MCGAADTFVARVETTIRIFPPATTARLEEDKEGEGRFWIVKGVSKNLEVILEPRRVAFESRQSHSFLRCVKLSDRLGHGF